MSDWMRRTDPGLGETIHEARLVGGPAVLVLPLRGYGKKYATFATRYGSVDNCFRLAGDAAARRVPDGIAHFLEHQMFAQEEGDAFERFAELGASANAYTSYTSTTYLFSTTENFEPSLDHLLDFVQQPHFTDAGTAKERGIIQQEIRMYEDNPGWRLRQALHAGLYQAHPFRIDIAGTVQSVAAIDTALLRQCYDVFYHPANMVVSVVGDVQPERILDQVASSLARHPRPAWQPPERVLPAEPSGVTTAAWQDTMSVARPLLAVGFKEQAPPVSGREQLIRDVLTEIGLEAVFGQSADLFARLYERGLIDGGFGAGYYGEGSFGLSRIGGETDRPDELAQEIFAAAQALPRDGIAAEACERQRRARLGDFIREFNSPESLGHLLTALHFQDADLFTYARVLAAATPDAVAARLAEHLDAAHATTASIRPRAAAE